MKPIEKYPQSDFSIAFALLSRKLGLDVHLMYLLSRSIQFAPGQRGCVYAVTTSIEPVQVFDV